MTIRVAAFDLDGTLVDTAGDLVATLNAVLTADGLAPVPFAKARATIGNGARAMLAAALAGDGIADVARLDRMTAAFMAYYADHLADTSLPFPGALAALDELAAGGWRLAICTNKFEATARSLLGRLGIGGRFATIAGQDTFGVRKPDPRHLTGTIERAGGEPGAAVMVGDSSIDAEAAEKAGVPIIFATFGYGPMPARAPDATISHYDELGAAIAGLARG
jgi:phosphoglycolate phosphatase